MARKEMHHNIPICLQGPDIKENLIPLDRDTHSLIHSEQNLPYYKVRRYREKINGILVPNDYCFDCKSDLWKEYFSGANNKIVEQKKSLIKQIKKVQKKTKDKNNFYGLDYNFDELISELIEQEKYLVNIALGH